MIRVAKAVGLHYNFEIAKLANTFDAHRIIQFSKEKSLSNETEERFFKAYFCAGELLSDHATLIRLAAEVGLDKHRVSHILKSNAYADAVNRDLEEARNFGIHAVPFFIFDRKYAVSGAQDPDVFRQALDKSFSEWQQ